MTKTDADFYEFTFGLWEGGDENWVAPNEKIIPLKPREKHVLYKRLICNNTLAEIAISIGKTRERVRQIEVRAFRLITIMYRSGALDLQSLINSVHEKHREKIASIVNTPAMLSDSEKLENDERRRERKKRLGEKWMKEYLLGNVSLDGNGEKAKHVRRVLYIEHMKKRREIADNRLAAHIKHFGIS